MFSAGPYAGAHAAATFLPGGPFPVSARHIDNALSNKFYPGRYALLNAAPGRAASLLEAWRIISFCIAPGEWADHIQPLRDHRTWADVEDCLAFRETGDERHIEAVWQRGRQAVGRYRNISDTERVATATWEISEAKTYVERVAGLADLMQKHGGVLPSADLHAKSGRSDGEIGVAIAASGELLHFRKGHHRMILARQLGMDRVNVEPHVVHADWLQGAHGLSDKDFAALIAKGSEEAAAGVRETIRKHLESFE